MMDEREIKARFRPLAGLSCINLPDNIADNYGNAIKFPSPRGVELHKPVLLPSTHGVIVSFRPLAGLSCINLTMSLHTINAFQVCSFRPLAGLSCINPKGIGRQSAICLKVSVPSRG